MSHKNHHCAKWVRKNINNWKWLSQLGLRLYLEYIHRYGKKKHSDGEVIMWCIENPPKLPDGKLTYPPQCMPDIYKQKNTIKAYRAYYNGEKRYLFFWTKRNKPYWIKS